jgi:hypothetical protein
MTPQSRVAEHVQEAVPDPPRDPRTPRLGCPIPCPYNLFPVASNLRELRKGRSEVSQRVDGSGVPSPGSCLLPSPSLRVILLPGLKFMGCRVGGGTLLAGADGVGRGGGGSPINIPGVNYQGQ